MEKALFNYIEIYYNRRRRHSRMDTKLLLCSNQSGRKLSLRL